VLRPWPRLSITITVCYGANAFIWLPQYSAFAGPPCSRITGDPWPFRPQVILIPLALA